MSSLSRPNAPHVWAVLLAGGDGTRLRSLTQKITSNARPKQFCRLFGDKSLLVPTQERLQPLFRRDRMMFVISPGHTKTSIGTISGPPTNPVSSCSREIEELALQL